VRSERAIQAIAGAPGQLGIARAYVNGDLDIHGDVYEAFDALYSGVHKPGVTQTAQLVREFAPAALKRLPPPPEEVRLSGRRHPRTVTQTPSIITTT
jgi:cyclopropane-fatty-acyl-phospholipid synthase